MSQMLVAARELALAAVDVLAAAGVPAPEVIAVDVKEGDWVPRGEGCHGCAQVVVTPATRAAPADNVDPFTGVQERCASRVDVEYRLQVGWCVSEDPDQDYGLITVDPADPVNDGTAWAEAAQVTATRDALARDLPGRWTARLCSALGPARRGTLVEATNWAEGACAGSDMRLQVSL